MPYDTKRPLYRRPEVLLGLGLAGLFYAHYELNGDADVVRVRGADVVLAKTPTEEDPFAKLVRTDPLAALIECKRIHQKSVRDYLCNLVKQELLPSGMTEEQEIAVKFRAEPFSVLFHWLRNQRAAERVIYVKDRWVDPEPDTPSERDLAVCQPGAVLRVLVKSVKQPIRGERFKTESRRSIDEFGFERSLNLLITYSELARSKNELELTFQGESYFDGRKTWVIQRRLPYTREGGTYPDRTAEIHIDQEYRIPVAIYCYADSEKKPEKLLAKYEYRNIRFDVGLTEKDFDPETYGM